MKSERFRLAALEKEVQRLKLERDAALEQVRRLKTPGVQTLRNQFLEILFDHIQAGVAVMAGPELRFTLVNQAYQGFRPGMPMIGLSYREVFPDAAAAGAEALLQKVLETGEPQAGSGYYAPIPGKPEAAWDHQIMRLPFAEGEEPSILVITWDVTEHKRIEAALRRSEERFRIAASASGMGAYSRNLLTGEDYWSPEFLAIYGITPEEQLQLEDDIPVLIHPEDRPRVLSEARSRLTRLSKPEFDIEHRIIRPDGQIRWVLVRGRMEFDPEGRPLGTFGIILDITERKLAEEALLRSEETLKLALEASNMGVWSLELNEKSATRSLEHDRIFGYDCLLPRWTYEMFLDHVLAEDRREVDEKFQAAISEGRDWHFECRIRRVDGEVRWIEARGRIVSCWDGITERMVGLVADITDRKHLEESLLCARDAAEEASRAKSEFLANMSHEIRTPMTVFMAAIEHLRVMDKDPEHLRLLDLADHSAKRLRTLIDDILDFSGIEAKRVRIEEDSFNLRACVRETVDMLSLSASEKSLEIFTEIASDAPLTVIGDKNRLGQVLVNLIGNAVKFTHEGDIHICVKPKGDLLEFSVSDTGIGIPEGKRDLLFQIFSQVDSSFTRKFGGMGLGLAISKGLVELMGGGISVESQEGKGSVFTFFLPLETGDQETYLPIENPSQGPGNQPSATRILVAEDEPAIRQLVTRMLKQLGFRVDTAENGKDAVREWEQGGFDLILMDLQMPVMNGIEAVKAIRRKEEDRGRRTCVVGLTAHARAKVKAECLKAGMDRVLTKPIKMEELCAAIEECLRS